MSVPARWAGGVLAALALAAGCDVPSRSVPEAAAARPSELVGLWRTVGPTIQPGTVLKLGADRGMFLFSACGAPFGHWRAVPGGALIAVMMVAAPDCPAVAGDDEWERNTPEWLRSVTGFRSVGRTRVLLDPSGRTVAELSPTDAAPGYSMPGARVPPDPASPADVARMDTATTPPSGSWPVAATALTGRWIPVGRNADPQVYVQFYADRAVKLRDGCNSARGRWTLGPHGAFAAVLYLSYVVSCANAPLADWLQTADWVSFDGPELVFTDSSGARLGALRRDADCPSAG